MISLTIKELSKIVKGRIIFPGSGFPEQKFTGVGIDSRVVVPASLFIALKGEHNDGHDFLAQAASRRAAAFLVEDRAVKAISPDLVSSLPIVAVPDTKKALAELATYYRSQFEIPVLAITGSNGKTTTKEMVAHILSAKYKVVKSARSFNTQIGIPLTIFELSPDSEVLVLELGTSQPGEIASLCQIAKPTIALILNIGPAHLETFGSVENVAKAKFELLENLPPDKPAFLNLDDPILKARAQKEKHRVISFGIQSASDYQSQKLAIFGNGHMDFTVKQNPVRLNLLGKHNVYNALAAFAVADYMGLAPQSIIQRLESFKPTQMRMEVTEIGGAKVIADCYNANPASTEAALETLAQTKTKGKKIALLADMLELGGGSSMFHQEIGGRVAALGIDILVTVGSLAEDVATGARRAGMSPERIESFRDNQSAALFLKQNLSSGDTLLLKGSRRMKLEEILSTLQEAKPA